MNRLILILKVCSHFCNEIERSLKYFSILGLPVLESPKVHAYLCCSLLLIKQQAVSVFL